MMKIDNSNLFDALKNRLQAQLEIDGSQFEPLTKLGAVIEIFEARDVLYRQGEDNADMFIVAEGWLIGSSIVRDGGRYIHRIYQAGDIIGAEDINWTYGTSTVETVTPVILGRFEKAKLFDLFETSATLGAAFYGLAMNDMVVAMDAARANARLNAAGRIGHLLLQLKGRQDLAGQCSDQAVFVPLTQTQIADALGLTNVSVSRGLTELSERGMIERKGSSYRLMKSRELEFQSNFTNRHAVSDHQTPLAVRPALGLESDIALKDMPVVLGDAG